MKSILQNRMDRLEETLENLNEKLLGYINRYEAKLSAQYDINAQLKDEIRFIKDDLNTTRKSVEIVNGKVTKLEKSEDRIRDELHTTHFRVNALEATLKEADKPKESKDMPLEISVLDSYLGEQLTATSGLTVKIEYSSTENDVRPYPETYYDTKMKFTFSQFVSNDVLTKILNGLHINYREGAYFFNRKDLQKWIFDNYALTLYKHFPKGD